MSSPPGWPAMIAEAFNTLSPQIRALGVTTEEVGGDFVILRLPYKPEMVGDPETGVIAGGVVTTLLDHACGGSILARQGPVMLVTLDLRIDYMRPAEPGQALFARAHCYKVGKSVAFVRAVAYERSPDDPVATAQAAFMLSPATEAQMRPA